jgi:hypothetical protein
MARSSKLVYQGKLQPGVSDLYDVPDTPRNKLRTPYKRLRTYGRKQRPSKSRLTIIRETARRGTEVEGVGVEDLDPVVGPPAISALAAAISLPSSSEVVNKEGIGRCPDRDYSVEEYPDGNHTGGDHPEFPETPRKRLKLAQEDSRRRKRLKDAGISAAIVSTSSASEEAPQSEDIEGGGGGVVDREVDHHEDQPDGVLNMRSRPRSMMYGREDPGTAS